MRLEQLSCIHEFEVSIQIAENETLNCAIFARSLEDAKLRAQRKYGKTKVLFVAPFPDIFETSAIQAKSPERRQADALIQQADAKRKQAKVIKARERVKKAEDNMRAVNAMNSATQR